MHPLEIQMVCHLICAFQISTIHVPHHANFDLAYHYSFPNCGWISFNKKASEIQLSRTLVVIEPNLTIQDDVLRSFPFKNGMWLIPSHWMESIRDHNIAIPLNSNVYVYSQKNWTISEIYRIKGGPLRKNDIFQWSTTNQKLKKLSQQNYLERRSNLIGTHLHALTSPWGNLCDVVPNANVSSGYEYIGLFHTIFKYMAQIGKFSYTITHRSNEKFHSFAEVGSKIQNTEADIGLPGFIMTKARANTFEMIPICKIKPKAIMKHPKHKSSFEFMAFLTVFNDSTWYGIVIITGLALLISKILFKYSFTITEQVAFIVSSFCQQSASVQLSTPSQSVFWLTVSVCGPFFFFTYSSMLVSDFTGKQPVIEINTYKDIFDSNYQISMWNNSATFIDFMAKLNEPFMASLAQNLRPHTGYDEALRFLQEDSNLIVIGNEEVFGNKGLHISDFKDGISSPWSYILPLESEFSEVFKYLYVRIMESGITNFEVKHSTNMRTKVVITEDLNGVSIGWELLIIPRSILFCGVLWSVLICLSEIFSCPRCKRRCI